MKPFNRISHNLDPAQELPRQDNRGAPVPRPVERKNKRADSQLSPDVDTMAIAGICFLLECVGAKDKNIQQRVFASGHPPNY